MVSYIIILNSDYTLKIGGKEHLVSLKHSGMKKLSWWSPGILTDSLSLLLDKFYSGYIATRERLAARSHTTQRPEGKERRADRLPTPNLQNNSSTNENIMVIPFPLHNKLFVHIFLTILYSLYSGMKTEIGCANKIYECSFRVGKITARFKLWWSKTALQKKKKRKENVSTCILYFKEQLHFHFVLFFYLFFFSCHIFCMI